LSRIDQIEKAANELLTDRRMDFTIVQATLAFLEVHKDRYPDAYERAKEKSKRDDQINAAAEMDGILRGITALNRSPQSIVAADTYCTHN
jgi:hypothetical protein